MSAPKSCSECGNPVQILLNQARNPKSRRARAGKIVTLKDHELCRQCWRGMIAQAEAKIMAMGGQR